MLYLRIENLCDAAEQKEEDECYEAFQLLHLSAATSYSSWLLEKKHHDNNSFENCTNDIFKSTINNVSKNNIINSNNNNTNSIMYECKRDQDQSVITKSHKYRKILKPIPTSFHSGCLVQNSQMNWFVYVSGCIQMSDHLVAVQVFDLDTRTWLEIFRYNGEDTDDDGADNISDENEDYEFEETPVQTWGHCACYSPLTKSLYVFGGAQDNDFQNDRLMEFSLKDCRWKWRRTRNECEFNDNTSPIGSTQLCKPPCGRQGHRSVYLKSQHKIVIFGGYAGYHLDDFFVYDIKENMWSLMEECHDDENSNRLSPREVFSMVLNEQRQSIVFFGGKDEDYRYNDMYEFSLVTKKWYRLHQGGPRKKIDSPKKTTVPKETLLNIPSPRSSHSCIMIEKLQQMVMFGGYDGDDWLNDCWIFDFTLNKWTKVNLFTKHLSENSLKIFQHGFSSHVAVFDDIRSEMLAFGGWTGEMDINAMWTITFPTLNELEFQSKLGNIIDRNQLSDISIITFSSS